MMLRQRALECILCLGLWLSPSQPLESCEGWLKRQEEVDIHLIVAGLEEDVFKSLKVVGAAGGSLTESECGVNMKEAVLEFRES